MTTGFSGFSPFYGFKVNCDWRPAQQKALDSFELDRWNGNKKTYIVAPPGSGKTILGLEILSRLNQPALVLSPTTTIAGQWKSSIQKFPGGENLLQQIDCPVHIMTYQSICRTHDPSDALQNKAFYEIVAERASASSQSFQEAQTEITSFTGAARTRFQKEVTSRVSLLKKQIARGEETDQDIGSLLDPGALQKINALKKAGVKTVVLDECHHASSMWGYIVSLVVDSLGEDVHVVGLTATPPQNLQKDSAALFEHLLGEVDIEIPAPAVVKDGYLAPFQELAYFVEPLQSETDWLKERHVRFDELLFNLHHPQNQSEESNLDFSAWIINRFSYRDMGDNRANVPFHTLLARNPNLCRAALRWLNAGGLSLPEGAPRGESFREPVSLEDWLLLIEDYVAGCLKTSASQEAEEKYNQLGQGLRDLGFLISKHGIRRGVSEVDRVLVESSAKPLAAVEILAKEEEFRGGELRAVVLCDTEFPAKRSEDCPLPGAGTRSVMNQFQSDLRISAMYPLMITGKTVACFAEHAQYFKQAFGEQAVFENKEGLCEISFVGWNSHDWVAFASQLLALGWTRLVVGTRGLLGEGWDAPRLNVVVDLTTVAADVSVRQMRGRSLRLDKADPQKVASNWDVVCVAPKLARGSADYNRFVRRHSHLHAPCEDGSIESGVSHVHPLLSPYTPPQQDAFAELNQSALNRAGMGDKARGLWAIGEPYVGEDVNVLLIKNKSQKNQPTQSQNSFGVDKNFSLPASQGFGLAFGLEKAVQAYPEILPLDRVASTVVEAYVELGEIKASSASSLSFSTRPGGTLRCHLAKGNKEENNLFTNALEEAISPADSQRYVLSRPMAFASLTKSKRLRKRAKAFFGEQLLSTSWHPVPSDFSRNKKRAEVFYNAWQKQIGTSEMLRASGKNSDKGKSALAKATGAEPTWIGSQRTLWH